MKKVLALILALAMVFCFCACGSDETKETTDDNKAPSSDVETSSTENSTDGFKVTVTDENGNPMANFTVQVCDSNTGSCLPAFTDEEGVAVFNNVEISSDYVLKVFDQNTYEIVDDEQEIQLDSDMTEYTIVVREKEA